VGELQKPFNQQKEFEMNFSKVLVAVSSAFVSLSAFAENAIVSVFPTAVHHIEVSDLCPKGAYCITGGTSVELTFMIPCAGELGPISTRLVTDSAGKSKLLVSAVAITTNASLTTRCFAQSFDSKTVSFPAVYLEASDIIDLNATK
jgi:hypothetical protein